jgi:hypothetical protein
MSAETAMRAGRTAAERLMTDTATVTGEPVRGPLNDQGTYDETTPQLYSGACKVKATDTLNQEVNTQGRDLVVQRLTVDFPVNEDTIFPADTTVLMTASKTDGALVGRRFRITGPHSQTYSTARRYPVEEVS